MITDTAHWVVETATRNGKYKVRSRTVSFDQAAAVYNQLSTHSGYKKRMRMQYPDGTGYVAFRLLTDGFDRVFIHPDYR